MRFFSVARRAAHAYVEHVRPRWSFLAGQAMENWAIVDTFTTGDLAAAQVPVRDRLLQQGPQDPAHKGPGAEDHRRELGADRWAVEVAGGGSRRRKRRGLLAYKRG